MQLARDALSRLTTGHRSERRAIDALGVGLASTMVVPIPSLPAVAAWQVAQRNSSNIALSLFSPVTHQGGWRRLFNSLSRMSGVLLGCLELLAKPACANAAKNYRNMAGNFQLPVAWYKADKNAKRHRIATTEERLIVNRNMPWILM